MFERTQIEEAKRSPGERVTLAGWVTRTRVLRKISFIILRDTTGEIQVTVKDGELRSIVEGLGREDVVSVVGHAVESQVAHAGVEFIPESIEVMNKAEQPLPFDLFGSVGAELDTRLNYRFMDFRTPKTSAIFRIQSRLLASFRRFLVDRGYLEIQPPCIIASASEGGADLFSMPYFERQAYLAQSPQLYKQMCAISLGKVFTVVPIWRAEKFNTPTHLNEVRQMDIEQAFADDENVMTLRRLTYTEAVELLQGAGEEMIWGEDFTKVQERRLGELVGEEAFFVKDWPSVQKAFYAMPYEENPEIVHAFDLLHNGIELSSGTQRIHLPELLRQQLRRKGLDPTDFTHYIESFSYGAPPHAGWSIGLERLTMTVTGMQNIRECTMFPRDRDRLVP